MPPISERGPPAEGWYDSVCRTEWRRQRYGTKMANIIEPYINADDIKRTNHCSDLEAAQMADELRNKLVAEQQDLHLKTVLTSTDRNLKC